MTDTPDATDVPIITALKERGIDPEPSKDTRNSEQRVQDVCFESLIRDYTERREWKVLEMINILYGKVLSDREVARV